MKFSLISAALVFGIVAPVCAESPDGSNKGKIRLTDAYIHASCELAKGPDITKVSPDKIEDAFAQSMALEEKYQDVLKHPYPPELDNYLPAPFEYAEHLLTGFPCEEALWTKAILPAGFRCRLDRMVFRDPTRKQELKAEGGNVVFGFLYEDQDKRRFEEKPRPLKAGTPRVVGSILVRGRLAGKSYTVVREWTGGSPVEALASRETNDKDPDDALMSSANLPYVTAANAAMFVLDLKNDTPAVKEMSGGPLKEFRFLPYRCQQ